MIIVEGLDNSGKSTLVDRLKEDFPKLTVVPSIGNKHDVTQIRRQCFDIVGEDSVNPFTLHDRCRFISEYVYNPVLKGRPLAVDTQEWLNLLGQWVVKPQLIIYCNRPIKRIMASFDEREQLPGVSAKLNELAVAYETVIDFLEYLTDLQHNGSMTLRHNFEHDDYRDPYIAVRRYMEVVGR